MDLNVLDVLLLKQGIIVVKLVSVQLVIHANVVTLLIVTGVKDDKKSRSCVRATAIRTSKKAIPYLTGDSVKCGIASSKIKRK